jgi:ElaB/YqjD/DUF883 family membrane-anchored ribosome-binding protein
MSKESIEKLGKDVDAKTDNVKRHIGRAAGEASDIAEMTYDELREQIAVFKSDIADLTAAMRDLGQAKVREAGAAARQTGQKAVSAAGDGYDYATEQVGDALSSAERFTRERPAMATAIAAGAGFLLALALSSRR